MINYPHPLSIFDDWVNKYGFEKALEDHIPTEYLTVKFLRHIYSKDTKEHLTLRST